MATLDTRLLPLIEALVVADADWIAFEVIEGVRLGRFPEETSDALERTRHAVRTAERPKRHFEDRDFLTPGPMPIVGDEQIEWAANYVETRMSDVVLMLQSALSGMDTIVSATPHDRSAGHVNADEGVTLVLQTDDTAFTVNRGNVANALLMVSRLREALKRWAASTRNGDVSQ
jgi:hypothetical protein